MTIGAQHGDTPCTMSPLCPKFDEYVLTTQHDGQYWWCFASGAPNSRKADTVHLNRTRGKTEEEAKLAMSEEYKGQRPRPKPPRQPWRDSVMQTFRVDPLIDEFGNPMYWVGRRQPVPVRAIPTAGQ